MYFRGVRAAVVLALVLAAVPAVAQPFKGTKRPDVRYVPSPDSVVEAMLELARVTASDVVYDLGSGDGRIPIAAAQRYGAIGVGVELDARLNREADDHAKKAGVSDRVRFLTQDLFETDISQATVVTLFLLPRINQDLILTLQNFWASNGCLILQPYDDQMGAGTFHPATTLRALGPRPWRAAYVQPSRRPKDGRYGENPNRL